MSKDLELLKNPIGVFQGFSNAGLEFHADIMLPYQTDFQIRPMHGSYLLVELENEDEAVLGRISSLQSMGRLSGSAGSEYSIRALQRGSSIPEDIRVDHLRYKVDVRVLGLLRKVNGTVVFAPSHRRLPHVGSRVAFPEDPVLKEISADRKEFGVPLGHLAMGEFVFALGDQNRAHLDDWHQLVEPVVTPRFDISHMVARKTFIFARAGYGKSNLNKLLFAELYKGDSPPCVPWSDGCDIPVGALLFDPEGEYFWPDSNGRPGFADVPGLRERLMVFTDREHPSPYYSSFKVGPAKMDLARMPARDVLAMGLSEDRLNQAWVTRINNLDLAHWSSAVTLIHEEGPSTDLNELAEALGLSQKKNGAWELTEQQLNAVRREVYNIVARFHVPGAVTLEAIEVGLRQGMMVVFDLSQQPPFIAENVTRRVMRHIFKTNQDAFTEVGKKPIPTIVIIEEAQTVLGGTRLDDTDPIVAWVKEGRKYNLGAVLVTQQPGAISGQILSQGDNWFVFHLISGEDLSTLKRANGHFSDDLLQSLLNEPIKGQGMFWSSESPRSYPIPFRVFSFERLYGLVDASGTKADDLASEPSLIREMLVKNIYGDMPEGDAIGSALKEAMDRLASNSKFMNKLRLGEVHTNYFAMAILSGVRAGIFPDKKEGFVACKKKIKDFLNMHVGKEDENWYAEKGTYKGKSTNYYKLGRKPS